MTPGPVTARKDDTSAAVQAAMANVIDLYRFLVMAG
jgi:hypothetical protein